MNIIAYTGILTLVLMKAQEVNPNLYQGIMMQIISTIFLFSPLLEYRIRELKEEKEQ